MKTPLIKFHHAILCDDVRKEDSGKLIFIGVYGPTLKVNKLPATLPLRAIIPVSAKDAFEVSFEFRVKLGRKKIFAANVTARTDYQGDSFIIIPQFILELDHPDVLNISVRLNEGKWQAIHSISFQIIQIN